MPSSKKPRRITRGGQPVRISERRRERDGNAYRSWEIFWRENGKPRCTSRSTYEDAHALAEQIAVGLAKGEIRQRILTGLELADYEEAIRICRETGHSLLDAARLLKSTKRMPQRATVSEVRSAFLASKSRRSKRHLETIKSETRLLEEAFGDRFILDVTVDDLSNWLQQMRVEPRTLQNHYTNNRIMFRWARKNNYLPDVETELEKVDPAIWASHSLEDWSNAQTPEDVGEVRVLRPDQLRLLLDNLPPKLIPPLVLGAFQGFRRSEIGRLHWWMVKPDQIRVPHRVARRQKIARTPPYLPVCKSWLEPNRQARGLIVQSSDRFVQLTAAARKLGIDPWPSNCLRHSYISYRLAMTNSVDQVAEEAGTSRQKINSNYREVVTKADAAIWFDLFPKGAVSV